VTMNNNTAMYPGLADLDPSEFVDLRGLEAPEPMVKILVACAQLGPNDRYLAHLPHVPTPLFPHLESRGLFWQVHEQTDGSALLAIRRNT